MRKSVFKTVMIAVIVSITNFAFAQEDEAGCTDHSFFNRMPGFYLATCEESFNEFEIVTGLSKRQALEGTVNKYEYYLLCG